MSIDTAGFADAQHRLRQALGVDVVFKVPVAPTWDPAEPLDPETGRPFDPFATPTSGGGTVDFTKRCSFVNRPLRGQGTGKADFPSTPLGRVDSFAAALIVANEDYEDVKDATRCVVVQNTWAIDGFEMDSLAGVKRWLAFLVDA